MLLSFGNLWGTFKILAELECEMETPSHSKVSWLTCTSDLDSRSVQFQAEKTGMSCVSHHALWVGVLILTLLQVFRSESSGWIPSCEHSFPPKNYCMLLLSSALKSFICIAMLARASWKLLPVPTFWQVLRLGWRQERGFAPGWCRNYIHSPPEMLWKYRACSHLAEAGSVDVARKTWTLACCWLP